MRCALAALLLAADLAVVVVSVILRSVFHSPVEWADDVARGLMVGSSAYLTKPFSKDSLLSAVREHTADTVSK